MGALYYDECTVYIAPADTDGSSLASSDIVSSLITNFKESGGEKDKEQLSTFGGGNIDIKKPRAQFEVSFDIVSLYSDPAKFDEMRFGAGLTSATDGTDKAIFLAYTDGTDKYVRAYNNATVTALEPEQSTDDVLKGTIVFKLSATDSSANANLQIVEADKSTITWS